MLLTHYYALVAIAGALTAAWLFRPTEQTTVTALTAFLGWALAAFLGGDVERRVPAGETIQEAADGTYLAVQEGTELVAAPVPESFRLFFALWALLSALTVIMYATGAYPPDSDTAISTDLS
jgi:hypothetical protein